MKRISQETIARVKEVTLVDLAIALGLPTKKVGKQIFIPCPNPDHQESSYEHCAIEVHKNIFKCFTCGNVSGKDAITLYSWFEFGEGRGHFKESVIGVAKLMDIPVKAEDGGIITPGSDNYKPSVKVVTNSLEPQDSKIIDAVYRGFLSLCPLREEHKKELLENRKYTNEEIQLYMFRSTPNLEEWIKIYSILKSKNYPLERIPGFSQIFQPDFYTSKFPKELGEEGEFADAQGNKYKGHWFYVPSASQGYFIPVFDNNGYITRLRIRKDSGNPKYVWFSSTHNVEVENSLQKVRRNGVSSGAPLAVEVPPNLLMNWKKGIDITSVMNMQTLMVTEGEHKAKIAAKVFGIPVVGLPGAGNFGALLKLLVKWNVKKLIIAYDMDTLQRSDDTISSINKQTNLFEIVKRFAIEVAKLGVDSVIWTWNMQDGKGIDDLVHNNKLPIEVNLRTGKKRGVTFNNIHSLV